MKPQCRDLEPLLASYVDGESAPEDRARVDAHIGRCPPCRDRVSGERAARDVLHARRSELRACAPAWLRARCEAQGRSRALLTRRTLLPLSLAASLVLALLGVFLFGLGDRGAALAAQISRDHTRCFEARPPQGGELDADQVGREWSQAQGWPLRVPAASEAADLRLLAVRRCLSTGGGSAHVLYTWRGEPLSLYVLPRPVDADDERTLVEKFGERAVIWTKGSRTYIVLSSAGQAGRPELDRIAAYMQNGAE